jgi:hypothetical protein
LKPLDVAKATECLEHVFYEIKSLVQAFNFPTMQLEGSDSDAVATIARSIHNALVEVRALHARNTVEFLLGLRSERKDDLSALDYCSTFEVDGAARATLLLLYRQACAQVTHLTINRVTDAQQRAGQGSKSWNSEHYAVLLRELRRFLATLRESEWVTSRAPGRLPECLGLENGLEITATGLASTNKP